jgi:chromosome segregation ATPase
MITNIDNTLEVKDKKIASLKQKVDYWKTERFIYSAELDNIKELYDYATKKIAAIDADLHKQDAAVKELYRTVAEKEELLAREIDRNRKLKDKYNKKDEQIVFISTVTVN